MDIKKIHKLTFATLILFASTIFLNLIGSASAIVFPTATLTITPTTQTVTTGTVSAQIRVNSSVSINAISVKFNYTTSHLSWSSTSVGSSYEVHASDTHVGGVESLAVGTSTPTTGDHLVATVNFTVTSPGSISFTPACNYISNICTDGNNVLSSTSNQDILVPSWTPLGGGFISGPATTVNGSGFNLFGVGKDNAIWQRTATGWDSRGGGFISGPGAITDTSGDINLFGVGKDKAIWLSVQLGSPWSPWSSIGGGFLSGPAVVYDPPTQNIYVFAVGLDKALWENSYTGGGNWPNGSWQGWSRLGGGFTSSPGAAIDSNTGKIYVFDVGMDKAIWQNTYTIGSWSGTGWSSLGGGFNSGSAAIFSPGPRVSVYAIGLDQSVWQNTYTGSWSGWSSLGGGFNSGPAAAVDGGGNVNIFGIGKDQGAWDIGQSIPVLVS